MNPQPGDEILDSADAAWIVGRVELVPAVEVVRAQLRGDPKPDTEGYDDVLFHEHPTQMKYFKVFVWRARK